MFAHDDPEFPFAERQASTASSSTLESSLHAPQDAINLEVYGCF
ncbi:hypothetical protein Vi05172_g2048 [Venturia inaequalis]|nr:hypothetical protein Vi05172_g2048 [Venturia inaequalis]